MPRVGSNRGDRGARIPSGTITVVCTATNQSSGQQVPPVKRMGSWSPETAHEFVSEQ